MRGETGLFLNRGDKAHPCLCCSTEKRKLRRDLITMGQDIKGGDSLFTRSSMEEKKNEGDKFQLGRVPLDSRKKCFSLGTVRPWNHLPRELVNYIGEL